MFKGLIILRFSCIRFAAFFAAAIGPDHPNTSAVAAQLPAVKINCTFIVSFSSSIRRFCLGLSDSSTYPLTAPAAVLAVFRQRSITYRTSQLPQ
jgi:hypothetical protein